MQPRPSAVRGPVMPSCRVHASCATRAVPRAAGPADRGIGDPWSRRCATRHSGDMDRSALADFLRRRRARLRPADVGLPPGVRRRTPGLRRDEVAALAAMSTDYYTRLEQGRGPEPVRPAAVRAGASAADDRRRARPPVPPGRAGTSAAARRRARTSRPACCTSSTGSPTPPALVVSDLGETYCCRTRCPSRCTGDQLRAVSERNSRGAGSPSPAARDRFPREDWATHSRTYVADLRATHGRRRGGRRRRGAGGDLRSCEPGVRGAVGRARGRRAALGQQADHRIPRSVCSTCCARCSRAGWAARPWSCCSRAREPRRAKSSI